MENTLVALKETIIKQLQERDKEFRIDFLRLDDSDFRRRIESAFKLVLRENRVSLKHHEAEEILSEVISYFLGLGPLESLLKDAEITEIMVNGPKLIYVERKGYLELTDITFRDEEQLSYFIEKILSPLGRRVTEYEPFVDARLKDGSRVNIVRSPVSGIGSILTIRKMAYRLLTAEDLIKIGSFNEQAKEFLKACVISKLNILICGGAGAGKTTLLNVLSSFIPEGERVLTIEDTRELHMTNKHTVPLETRPASIEGKGEITIRSVFKNSLHMRPDRIIIGEVRSGEVLDMIQAMNTGQEGSMTTLHANSPLEALDRLEILALLGSSNISSEVARRQIISAIDIVIDLSRLANGSRKIMKISEVLRAKEYLLQDIFIYNEETDVLQYTGHKPSFCDRLRRIAKYECERLLEGK